MSGSHPHDGNGQQPEPSRAGELVGNMLGGGCLAVVGGIGFAALAFLAVLLLIAVVAFFLLGGTFAKVIAVLLVAGAAWGAYDYFFNPPPPAPAYVPPSRPSGAFGDGGFAMSGEMQARDVLCCDGDPDRLSRGVFLQNFVGSYGNEKDRWQFPWNLGQPDEFFAPFGLTYRGEAHGVTIAPTRSGKGTGAIIPTLLMTGESLFVLDVKGENWFVTHKSLERRGYRVRLLNPFQKWGSDLGFDWGMHSVQFNPLAQLQPGQSDFVDTVRGMAAALIVEQGKEPHFTNRARDLVACLIAHVVSDDDELRHGRNHLPRVREILGFQINLFCAYMMAAANSRVALVRNNAASFASTKPEDARELQSIISTALGQLGWLDDDQIIHFLPGGADEVQGEESDREVNKPKRGDFDFSELRQPGTAVFFLVGAEQLQTYQGFVRLMVQNCFNTLWKTPAPNDASVLMVLDEIYQLGQLEILKRASGLMAGFGVRMWSIFQDLGQLKEVYGDAWETVIANAGFVQILGVNDMTTAEYFSRKIGKSTLTLTSFSGGTSSSSSPGGGSSYGSSSGWSEHTQANDAVSPQTLLQLGRDRDNPRGLLFVKDEPHPALTTNIAYYDRASFTLPYPLGVPADVLPNAARPDDYERGIAAAREWQAERQQLRNDAARAEFYGQSPALPVQQ